MVASSIPVYGRALGAVINTNTTVSLAAGESVDQSLVDGIGGAPPAQPTSGTLYRAGVSIARGVRFDRVAIGAHGLDRSVTDRLSAADLSQIARHL